MIGIDARDEGLALSKEYGADIVIDIRKDLDAAVKEVHAVTNGHGVDSTIGLSDHPTAAATACAITRFHGVLVQIAQPDQVSVPFHELIFRDIKIHGSLISSAAQSEEMVKCVSDNGISFKSQVFHRWESFESLLDQVHEGKVKGKALIVVDPAQIEEEKNLGAKH